MQVIPTFGVGLGEIEPATSQSGNPIPNAGAAAVACLQYL